MKDTMENTVNATLPPVEAPLGKIAEALAKAQAEIGTLDRNREVDTGKYKFRYATLDAVIDHVRPALTKNGLWFVQILEPSGKDTVLVTTLLHSSGQSITSRMPLLVVGAGNQAFGGALTYMRRYALTALLGVAADEDDDDQVLPPTVDTSNGFSGPLTKTALKEKMRKFAGDLDACSDMGMFIGLVEADEMQAVLRQCQRDLPEWYWGKNNVVNGKTIHEDGAKDRIDAVRKHLEEHERNR